MTTMISEVYEAFCVANEPEENARKVLDQLIEKGAKRLLKEVLGK